MQQDGCLLDGDQLGTLFGQYLDALYEDGNALQDINNGLQEWFATVVDVVIQEGVTVAIQQLDDWENQIAQVAVDIRLNYYQFVNWLGCTIVDVSAVVIAGYAAAMYGEFLSLISEVSNYLTLTEWMQYFIGSLYGN
jgi:hypothetical protein